MKKINLILPLLMLIFNQQDLSAGKSKIKLGIEVLVNDRVNTLKNKRVGLITNPTGVDARLRADIDILAGTSGVNLVALYGPEHGIRGDVPGGEHITSYPDPKTKIPVYSLYGSARKPTSEMVKDIDVLVFHIQDVGARYYTYIYTMALAMQAAKENNLEFIVLDRPNPLGGIKVEGPVLDPEYASFIGMYPIPIVHGMTVGELAQLFNSEFGIGCKLTVVPMEEWTRDMLWEDTGLDWINTSPHIPTPKTVLLYPAIGFIGELKLVSEGGGTTRPFEYIGAPWIDAETLATKLNELNLPGVYFRPVHYQPFYHTFTKEQVNGVQIHLTDTGKFQPVSTGIHILYVLNKLYPDKIIFPPGKSTFNKAMGTDKVGIDIKAGKPAVEIIQSWQVELNKFKQLRTKYLLYR